LQQLIVGNLFKFHAACYFCDDAISYAHQASENNESWASAAAAAAAASPASIVKRNDVRRAAARGDDARRLVENWVGSRRRSVSGRADGSSSLNVSLSDS